MKMHKVHFTSALNRFFPNLESIEVHADTMHELLELVDHKYPGMKSFLVEDTGELRKHVNLFVGEELADINDDLATGAEVFIFQALSGG